MALERKDVRFKLDAVLHAQLRAICDLDEIDIGDFVESLVTPVIRKRVHDAMLLAERLQRAGISGRTICGAGKVRERAGMTPSYDFRGLTQAQQWLLTFQGWEPARDSQKQPSPATARKLIERGLVIERAVTYFGLRFTAYDVPLAVHAAWCRRCSELESRRAARSGVEAP